MQTAWEVLIYEEFFRDLYESLCSGYKLRQDIR